MTPPAPRPGIIGLGLIGGGIAVSLMRSGQTPVVFDVREDASSALKGVPAQLNSPVEVARASDVVLIAVVTAQQVEDVLIGENGLLSEPIPGLLVVLLSTVSLDAVRHLAKLCDDRGAVLMDAGVSGGATAYDNGLTVMIGGSDEDVKRAMPVLDGFAKAVIHCGPLGRRDGSEARKECFHLFVMGRRPGGRVTRDRRRGRAATGSSKSSSRVPTPGLIPWSGSASSRPVRRCPRTCWHRSSG